MKEVRRQHDLNKRWRSCDDDDGDYDDRQQQEKKARGKEMTVDRVSSIVVVTSAHTSRLAAT